MERNIFAEVDIADEADVGILHHLVIGAGDIFRRLVIGRDPGADQPVRRRQLVENVDARIRRLLDEIAGRIHSRRPRSDNTYFKSCRHTPPFRPLVLCLLQRGLPPPASCTAPRRI